MSVAVRVAPAEINGRYQLITCEDCGLEFFAYKGGRGVTRCLDCQKKYYRSSERRREIGDYVSQAYVCEGDGQDWRLINDPRGVFDEWGSLSPVFCTYEIWAAVGRWGDANYPRKPYARNSEYPFNVGCEFANVKSGRRLRVGVKAASDDTRYLIVLEA